MKRNENKLIFEQYKLIKEADEQEHTLNKIREYIKTLEHEDEMSRIVSIYNNIAVWAAQANISDETLKTVLSPKDFNLYQHYYPADLKHPHKDLTLRQDTHYRSVKENNNRLTLQQAINTANKENINHVVYVDVYNSIEDKQNATEADISDWDDWADALRYIQSQRLDPNLVTMRGEDEAETMELHITTNDGGRTWELDRYRLGQDSDLEEAKEKR